MGYFTFLLLLEVFDIRCIFYTSRMFPFERATFQVPSGHMTGGHTVLHTMYLDIDPFSVSSTVQFHKGNFTQGLSKYFIGIVIGLYL